jgi:hypothetical protein
VKYPTAPKTIKITPQICSGDAENVSLVTSAIITCGILKRIGKKE